MLLLAMSGTARAQEERPYAPSVRVGAVDGEIAGKASYLTPPVRGGTSPFGAGFGGRLGFTMANVYVGASVVDYLGGTDVDAWSHGVLYGGELGYGIRLTSGGGVTLTLRPQIGVGGLTVFRTTPTVASTTGTNAPVRVSTSVDVITTATGGTSSGSGTSSSSSSSSPTTTTTASNLYVQPSVVLLLSSAVTFVGVNASMLVVPSFAYGENDPTTWVCYALEGQLGLRF